MGEKLLSGCINISDINASLISENLYTRDFPDVDLLIRTGKAHRLSNFMLWQTHYSEIFFSDSLWPDFTEFDFRDALSFYAKNYKTKQGY